MWRDLGSSSIIFPVEPLIYSGMGRSAQASAAHPPGSIYRPSLPEPPPGWISDPISDPRLCARLDGELNYQQYEEYLKKKTE